MGRADTAQRLAATRTTPESGSTFTLETCSPLPQSSIGRSSGTVTGAFAVAGSDTAREVAQRVAAQNPDAGNSLTTLAATLDNATYSGDDIDTESADAAEQISKDLTAAARESHTTTQWWLRHMNPLNVFRDKVGAWGALRN